MVFNISKGPTIIIETPEPTEDFVVLCNKSKNYIISHGAGSYNVIYNVRVAKSGEKVDCGYLFTGEAYSTSVLHPIYTGDGSQNYVKDGIKRIVLNKTKLQILDEQKAKFEAGEWDNHLNPGAQYARNLTGCGFPNQYFDYYKEDKKVDKEHFKKLYHEPMLECFIRSFAITKEYDPQIGTQLPDAYEWMRRLWASDKWSKY